MPNNIIKKEYKKIEGDFKFSIYFWLFSLTGIPSLFIAWFTALPGLFQFFIFYGVFISGLFAYKVLKPKLFEPVSFDALSLSDLENSTKGAIENPIEKENQRVLQSPSNTAPLIRTVAKVDDHPENVTSQPTSAEKSSHIGLSGTGVTASLVGGKVIHTFGEGRSWFFGIENNSRSGTITNIGFIIKTNKTPTWIEKVESNGVTGPGKYRFTKERWEINTLGFKAISAFGLATYNSVGQVSDQSFHDGMIGYGIPPGKATRFCLTGLNEFSINDLKRSMVFRFQAIDEDNKADIAMFKDLDKLSPTFTEDSIYAIERIS
jgi:hypothetical protein